MSFDVRSMSEGQGFLVSLLVLLALTFVCFAAMIGLRIARRGAARFWMGPAMVALALLPGVVSVGLAALAFRNVLSGMALTGSGGVAAVAAGSAESFIPLLIGLACVMGLTVLGLLLISVGTSKVDAGAAESGVTAGTWLAPLAVLVAFGMFALLATLISRVNFGLQEPGQILLWWRASAFGAAAVALGLLVFAVASAFAAPRGRAPLAAKVVPVMSLLLAGVLTLVAPVLLWTRMDRLANLAMTGGPTSDVIPGELEAPSPASPEATVNPAAEPEESIPSSATPPPPPSARPSARPSPRPTPRPSDGVPAGVVGSILGGLPDAPAPGALRVGGQIKEPKKLKHVTPSYPEIAKQARVQGIVILECTISPQGRVTDVRVLRGIPLLDNAAIAAVKQWVYEPTLLNGVPVALIMTVTVNFRLS